VIAVVGGLLGLAGAGLGAWASVRAKRIEDRSAHVLVELRSRLEEIKDIRAEARSKQARAEQLVSRYREPLLSAAFELQSKIFNVVQRKFLRAFWERSTDYARDHTLFVFAQYFCWREIIRQEVQFLDLGDTTASAELSQLLEAVTDAFSTDRLSATLMVFRGEQRAIGEKMMVPLIGVPEAVARHECLGYAAFVESLRQADFARWFKGLGADVHALATNPAPDYERLSVLQNALVDLIERLDTSRGMRFPDHLRKRLFVSAELGLARAAVAQIKKDGVLG
jgi:hypothetical protein